MRTEKTEYKLYIDSLNINEQCTLIKLLTINYVQTFTNDGVCLAVSFSRERLTKSAKVHWASDGRLNDDLLKEEGCDLK